jgi:hypothetical protein
MFGGQSLVVELRDSRLSSPVADNERAGGPPLNAVLDRALPGDFRYLIMLDPYGGTIFNEHSMALLIPELEQLRTIARSDLEARTLDRVIWLAQRCANGEGSFLIFGGD